MKGSDKSLLNGANQHDEQVELMVAAAHELKSPLALIRQLSLSLEQGGLSQEDEHKILRQIILTSEKSLRLTSDLTRQTRLEDSLFSIETINSRQLCEEVAHQLMPLYRAKGRELRVEGGKRQTLALANRDLLSRILINFGDNALNYVDSSQPVVLKAASLDRGERVKLGVRDYGPAVSGDVWQKIKRHLGTAPQAIHSRPASSGLGLYIAGQFAEAMQGSVGATRHHDGATFYVDLLASKQLSLL